MLTTWWQTIWDKGILIADRQQNPALYPFLLAAIAITAGLAVVDFAIDLSRRRTRGWSAAEILRVDAWFLLRRVLLPLYAVWLAFATPPTRLFIGPPTSGAVWLFLPALPSYTILAVCVHGVLAFFGARSLTLAWLIYLRTPDGSRRDQLAILATYIALVVGWEVQRWPVVFLVLAEYFVMTSYIAGHFSGFLWGTTAAKRHPELAGPIYGTYFLAFAAAVGAIVVWHDSPLVPLFLLTGLVSAPILAMIANVPAVQRRLLGLDAGARATTVLGLASIVNLVLWLGALAFEGSGHPIDQFAINLAGAFVVLIQVDTWAAISFGAKRYGRAFVLAPLMAILTTVLASGALDPVTRNHGLNEQTWLEGGVAATMVLLFLPLTELVRESFRINAERSRQRPQYPALPGGPVVDANPPGAQRLLAGPSRPLQSEAQAVTGGEEEQGFLPRPPRPAGIQTEYQARQFQAGVIVFALAVAYHFIEAHPDVLATQHYDYVGLAFAAVAAATAFIALLATREDNTLQAVLLLLVVLVGILGATDLWLNALLPASGTTFSYPQAPFALFSDSVDTLRTVHNGVQEALFLLAASLFVYMLVVIRARVLGGGADVRDDT